MTERTVDKQRYIEQHVNTLFAAWLSQASRWGAVIFVSLSVLDYVSAREHFLRFLFVRIAVAALLLVVSLLAVKIDPQRIKLQRALAYAALIGSALAIELMIMKLGGHQSPYYAGMILLGICVIGFVPGGPLFHVVSALLIYGFYALPILAMEHLTNVRSFLIDNVFLIATLVSMLLMRYLGQKSLISELGLKFDLEQQQTGLEEDIQERTAQLYATITDLRDMIAERRKTELTLRESEEKFRTLFEESKDVFYISTPEGRFLDINPAGVELFGYSSKEELLAIDITRDLYVNPRDRKRFIETVDRTDYAKDYEVLMKRKSGEKLFVIITSTAVRDEQGKLTTFRGVIRDVTEQKKLEQQLLQSQKMEAIGQLAGGIAHDFNNILTAIVGYASILRRKLQKDDPGRVYVEHVLEASERGAGLTHSLLAFGTQQVMNPRQVDLNEIVRNTEKFLARLIGEDISMRTMLDKNGLIVIADSLQMEQVLINLATNARDAMPRGGIFTIETRVAAADDPFVRRRPGSYAEMVVSDTGKGLDAALRDRIFEPFFTTKETGKGSGLGLAIVYGIIKQHNGHIMLSTEDAQGASFRIYLPLAPAGSTTVPVPAENHGPPPCGAETILLAEDDKIVRTMVQSVLGECGYTVIEAVDGEEALEKFIARKDDIDLLILDLMMPKKNGKEVYDAVQRIKPGVKVLFTSGYTADVIRARGILDEGLHLIQKPISMDDLLRKIRTVVKGLPPEDRRS